MIQQNGMATYNVAQNPAAQQMLQSFMQNGGGQQMVKPATQDTTIKGGHEPVTPKTVLKNALTQPLLPVQQFIKPNSQDTGNYFHNLGADAKMDYGIDAGERNLGKTQVIQGGPAPLQNNAPQIDWSKLLTQQGQQPQIQPMM